MMFKNIHGWPLEHWHIELCSKCSLKCPRCSRQEVPHGLTNTDLTLDWFKKNFNGKLLTQVRKITLCGDDGDPIYAKDLVPIVSWIRQHNKNVQFVIVTNGSYKTKSWWQALSDTLDHRDHVHFSIDGWDQQSNDQYRVNCDWGSIMEAVSIMSQGDAYLTWAAIAFKFNEHKIDHMKQMAEELGFDAFQLTLSSKFGKNYGTYPKDDPLQPSDRYVASGRFVRDVTRFTKRKWVDLCKDVFTQRFLQEETQGQSIIPLCMIGNKGLYINAKGKFFPCCWTGLRYQHNQGIFDYVDADQTLGEVLDDPMWKKLFMDMAFNEGPRECGEKCSAEKWSLEHATNW